MQNKKGKRPSSGKERSQMIALQQVESHLSRLHQMRRLQETLSSSLDKWVNG